MKLRRRLLRVVEGFMGAMRPREGFWGLGRGSRARRVVVTVAGRQDVKSCWASRDREGAGADGLGKQLGKSGHFAAGQVCASSSSQIGSVA